MEIDDVDPSTVHYKEIVEIEGYTLRKPLTIVIFESHSPPFDERYKAMHILPSRNPNQEGESVKGLGETEDEAVDNLTKKITDLYDKLCPFNPESREQIVQRAYLKSIMVKE